MLVCAYHFSCTRDRGCTVHPAFPRALHSKEGGKSMANLEQSVLRECEPMSHCYSHVAASLRGALATKQSTLACFLAARWIASLTLAMTAWPFRKLNHVRARHTPMSSPDLIGRPSTPRRQ